MEDIISDFEQRPGRFSIAIEVVVARAFSNFQHGPRFGSKRFAETYFLKTSKTMELHSGLESMARVHVFTSFARLAD